MTNPEICWIPGGGSGIGFAAAQALTQGGHTVVLSGRRENVLAQEAEAIRASGGKADYVVVDVADAAAVAAAHATIVERHGPVTTLINSAGYNIADRTWSLTTPAAFSDMMDTNLNGTFYAIEAVLPGMRALQRGMIVNIVSWAGRYVAAGAGAAYTASKHAVFALTASLNLEEAGNGIRACAFCPGEIDTPIMLKRKQPPTEEQRLRMLGAPEVGELIRYIVELPPTMNVTEIVLSSTGRSRGA